MSNQAFRFTDKDIKDIKPTAKREYYHDTVEKDLLLQVTPNGAKTFYIYKRMKMNKTDFLQFSFELLLSSIKE